MKTFRSHKRIMPFQKGQPVSFSETEHFKTFLSVHDNDSSHLALLTMEYLKLEQIKFMTHYECSSDLIPNDYVLFTLIKNCVVNVLTVLKKLLKLTNTMFLQCRFQSGIYILKIGLFEYKSVSVLEEIVLRSSKTYNLSEKMFLALLSKNYHVYTHLILHFYNFK